MTRCHLSTIDLDGAMEQLAEQAANEDKSDPAASNFRLALIKLMNSVKKRECSANRGICEEMPRYRSRKCEERH